MSDQYKLTPHDLLEDVRESGLKQKWLAKRMGISEILLNYYLVGRRNMPPAIEYKIIRALEHMEKMDLR